MDKDIRIVNISRTPYDQQVYMQSFCEAWIKSGGKHIQQSRFHRYRLVRHFMKMLALTRFTCRNRHRKYIICSRGGHLLKSSLPYHFLGEIIPMLWDCWPAKWEQLEHDLRLMQCRLCFITASDVVGEMSKRLPNIKFVYVPEGVDVNDYQEGSSLCNRPVDVYELGARHNYYHKKLIDSGIGERYKLVFSSKPSKGLSVLYDNWYTFTSKIPDAKIVISFPLSMRNPYDDGNVDTLTIRYWEAMLSRCVIVGHCPQELANLIGYNPVIEADFFNTGVQLCEILENIEKYQELVNRNRQTALEFSPWINRMEIIRSNIANYQ